MPTIFHNALTDDAHDQFQKWRESNSRGFIINRKTRTAGMLHLADCQHMGNFSWTADESGGLTKSEKICSADRTELEAWARQNGLYFTICNDCMKD